jgi:hypothetical protein
MGHNIDFIYIMTPDRIFQHVRHNVYSDLTISGDISPQIVNNIQENLLLLG